MAEYDQYCNLPDNSPWAPTLPGLPTEDIPAAPVPEQGTAIPPNSTQPPPGFNEDSPNLCEIFNDIVSDPSDPDYEDYYDNPPAVPPFNEAVYINCPIRVATVSGFLNWPVSAKDEDLCAQIGIRVLPDGGIGTSSNLITIPGIYSQSSLYSGAELADYESMSNGLDSETLKTVTNADFEAWIQIDFTYDTYIAQLEIGCDFENSLPGGFGKWAADFALIQYKAEGAIEWTELAVNIGEFLAPTKYHYVGQLCRYIRILQYSRNLAITEFAAKSDRWIAPFACGVGIGSLAIDNTPINQNLFCSVACGTGYFSTVLTPDKLLYLMDFESTRTSPEPHGAFARSWHENFTRYWSYPAWPPNLISTSSPIIGSRSLILPDHPTSNYAMRFSYTPYFNMENEDWHIKLYCTPATIGTSDGYGNFYQYLLDLASLIRIGIDDEGYYFFEVINTAGSSNQLVGGKFKDGNENLLAINGEPVCLVASCEGDEFSVWLNGEKQFAEPKVVAMPGLSRFSISFTGQDCFIGAKSSIAAVDDANMFRGGKIDHIAIYKGVAYYAETDPFQSPTPLPPAQPAIPQFIAPLDALNSGYFASASAGLTAQNSTSRSLAVPLHAENDLLIALIHYRKPSSEIMPPLGWVLESGDIGSELLQYDRDARIHIYSKVARDDEESSYTWTSATGSAINAGLIVTVRNGVITQVENKIAPLLTAQEIEGFPTYYTFDGELLHLEAAFDELLIAGNCRTWTSGYPEQEPALLRIDNNNPRTGLQGPRTEWAFPVELLRGPGAVVGYGAGSQDSMNLFGVKLKLGQPVPRYVVARTLRPAIGVSNAIEIIKTSAFTPLNINPFVWLNSNSPNNFSPVPGQPGGAEPYIISVWLDLTTNQRNFAPADYIVSDQYRPRWAEQDPYSGIRGVAFRYPTEQSSGNTVYRHLQSTSPVSAWSFLRNEQFSIFIVTDPMITDLTPNMGGESQVFSAGGFSIALRSDMNSVGVVSHRIDCSARAPSISGNSQFLISKEFSNAPIDNGVLNIYHFWGNLSSPTASERMRVAVNGQELTATNISSNSSGVATEGLPIFGGTPGGFNSIRGIVYETLIWDRILNSEEIQNVLCYLAGFHKLTGKLPLANACRNTTTNADRIFSDSSTLKFTTSPVTFTAAPVNSPVLSDSFVNSATARTADIAPVFAESYCPNPTPLIRKAPLSAIYSQSSVFNENPPFAEPATELNMQNFSADETLATATNGDGGWVMMDFLGIATIERVVVGTDLNRTLLIGDVDWWWYWDRWYTEGAKIQYSMDGQTWTTLIESVDFYDYNQDVYRSIVEYAVAPSIQCVYLRIGYVDNPTWYFAVTEFHAIGSVDYGNADELIYSESYCLPAVATTTAKFPATYSQSSVYTANGVQAATMEGMQNESATEPFQTGTDSNTGTNWVAMDLGEVKPLSIIVIGCDFYNTLGAGDWGRSYTEFKNIEKSDDNITWTIVMDTGAFLAPIKEFDLTGHSARYIRLAVAGWLAVTEFHAKP